MPTDGWAHDRDKERQPQSEVAPHQRREDDLLAQAGAVGNAGMVQLARQGAGLLDGGRVHPDVESLISQQRGGGNTLDPSTRGRLAPSYGDPLDDVRVHTDTTADHLARSVDARAFTVGADVFFASGEYAPGSSTGDGLIAHEVAHVVQQRGATTSGPLTATQPGDAVETDADAAGAAALGGG